MTEEWVNHPRHYNLDSSGVETIDVVEHFSFNIGNAVKYVWRRGAKKGELVEDLNKALWYLNREREQMARYPPLIRRAVQHEFAHGPILSAILGTSDALLRRVLGWLDYRFDVDASRVSSAIYEIETELKRLQEQVTP